MKKITAVQVEQEKEVKSLSQKGIWRFGSLFFSIAYALLYGNAVEASFRFMVVLFRSFIKNEIFEIAVEIANVRLICLAVSVLVFLYLATGNFVGLGNVKFECQLILLCGSALLLYLDENSSVLKEIAMVLIFIIFYDVMSMGREKSKAIFSWPMCTQQATRPYSNKVTAKLFWKLICCLIMGLCLKSLNLKLLLLVYNFGVMQIMKQVLSLYDQMYDETYKA